MSCKTPGQEITLIKENFNNRLLITCIKKETPLAGRRTKDTIFGDGRWYQNNIFFMKSQNNNVKKERVIVYVDGFNLYFGMVEAGLHHCKWLDLKILAKNLLKPHQKLQSIKYFTSRVSNNPKKQKRQTIYIEAIETIGIEIIYGQYQSACVRCTKCGHCWNTFNEKMTDVNLATYLLVDAYKDKYDTAMLISGDSDLVPPISAVNEKIPNKRVLVAFPPKRKNVAVAKVAKGNFVIGRRNLEKSQLPDKVEKSDGYILRKPEKW